MDMDMDHVSIDDKYRGIASIALHYEWDIFCEII